MICSKCKQATWEGVWVSGTYCDAICVVCHGEKTQREHDAFMEELRKANPDYFEMLHEPSTPASSVKNV